MRGFFDWYKNSNIVVKILLFGIPLLMGLLWIVGSFTKIDRLVMFVVGLLIGGLLINIFLGEYITIAINWFKGVFAAMF
ncbi:MAG: hypothetical protein J6V68_01860 [Clostridia bacterium]|nr:hypothetical protein [Clostridia bacterium]